jgi:hypothetical protein
VKWNEVQNTLKNGWLWSQHDSTYNFRLMENLPIRDAETSKLDLAAFFVPSEEIPYLSPTKQSPQKGDTVFLFSRVSYNGKATLENAAIVIYLNDSILTYELLDFNGAQKQIMGGTSGSAILNKEGDVVSNSFGGFTLPNEQVMHDMTNQFPLLKKFDIRVGKSYGFGLRVSLIEENLIQALQSRAAQKGKLGEARQVK